MFVISFFYHDGSVVEWIDALKYSLKGLSKCKHLYSVSKLKT